jgi:predicted metal-binding membrane protein
MNLVWIAGLAVLVLAEKLVAEGHALGRAAGAAMIAAGVYLLVA